MALKYLVDNAIKYASDTKVEITITHEGISITKNAPPFTDDLDSYFKPFHGKGKGLDLGLYIVHNIMEKLKLDYSLMKLY